MKKLLFRLILLLVVLVVLAGLLVVLFINPLAKSAVQEGTSYALGVETSVDDADVSILGGQVVVTGLDISNPEGFASTRFVRSGKFEVVLKPASLFSDTVELTKFEIDGLEMHIEQKLPYSNISKILEHIKGLGKGQEKSEAPDKKVTIDRVVIRDVKAYFHMLSGLTGGEPIMVPIPELILTNVSSEDGGPVVGQLVAQIIPAILAKVVDKAQGQISVDFLKDIDTTLLSNLGQGVDKAVEDLGKTMEDTGLDKVAEDAGKTIEKGLGDIFGGKDK